MECPVPNRRGKIPAGKIIHIRKAAPSPQISPAPALVVLAEKKSAKASPKNAPSNEQRATDAVRSAPLSAPPAQPTASPSAPSIQFTGRAPGRTCPTDEASKMATNLSSLQLNRLNNVSREEKLDRPIHEHANLSL